MNILKNHLLLSSFLLFFCNLSIAATISPWGDVTLKNFDILLPNSGGLDLIVDGNTTYLASEFQGLYILDTSDLDEITVKYQLTQSDFGLSGSSLYTIVKNGNYLYCGFRRTSGILEGYLKIVNLTNLDTTGPVIGANDLVFGGGSFIGGRLTGLFLNIETQELYAALRFGGLALIDVSNPPSPVLVGIFDPGSVEHQEVIIDRNHNRAYFGGWFRGIGSVDISDASPSNWVEYFVDDVSANDRYWYLVQRDQYLYASVADSPSDNTFDEGLAIYNLTENFTDLTKQPVRLGFAPIPAQFQCESAPGGKDEGLVGGDPAPHQVILNDNYAIVANGCMGVAIFDISDPYKPFFVKGYQIPGQADYPWSVEIIGDSLITVGRNRNDMVNNDVYVFKITPVTFSFNDQTDLPTDSMIYSEIVTIKGLGIPMDISISNGEYSINNGSFSNAAATINDGDSIQVRLISSSDNSAAEKAIITIGGVSATFNVTTIESAENNSNGTGSIYIYELIFLLLVLVVQYRTRRQYVVE